MTDRPKHEGPDDLEHLLYELTKADDPEAFAQRHGLLLDDDRVRVVVILRDGRELPSTVDFTQTARVEGRIEGTVPIDQLRPLAAHENTTAVRTPDRPEPDGPGTIDS